MPFIHAGGKIGILFSLFVVGLAAFNLLLDFDMIEKGAAYGAPKSMEWYGAFGLMVTLVWLYLEVLRLLQKVYSRAALTATDLDVRPGAASRPRGGAASADDPASSASRSWAWVTRLRPSAFER